MIKVYHFANLTYGLPFLENYASLYIALLQKIEVTVVLSLKRRKPEKGWRWIKHQVYKFSIEKRHQRKFAELPFKIVVIENVNAPYFIENIPTGSIGMCSGFNQIFSSSLITRFEHFINVHPSVLPFYRGPVPSYWCLKNEESQTGYTLHSISPKIDAGKIIGQGIVQIDTEETEESLDKKIAIAARGKLFDWLEHIVSGKKYPENKVDARGVYKNEIDYLSFPEENKE